MTINPQGTVNLTALVVPDLIVQILAPNVAQLNGVPTNILGIVGTASWGPLNSPTIIGDMSAYTRNFGPLAARKYDAGTAVAIAVQQGASNFRVVRVSDGTDAAAAQVVQTTCITLTAKYTGVVGNTVAVTLATGSAASSFKVTVALPGYVPEVFDNITGSGNALWINIANAINLGQGPLRGPSTIITAAAGAGTTTPTLTTYTLSGGLDGAAISATNLVGSDSTPRTGMYALRGTGAQIAMLADCDTSTTWATQVTFGLAEGIYMIGVGPATDTIANAVSVKASAGIDSYAFKLLFGDWIYWNDTVNAQQRLVSPQAFAAGMLANLSPEQSSLNKPMGAILGTQKSYANQVYSGAELQTLGQAGIDLITNPVPGGNFFGARFGRNSSSSVTIRGDNYTRLTNYLASTFNGGLGVYVGKLQTPEVRQEAAATLSNFLEGMASQGMIGNAQGTTPYTVQIDDANNPGSRVTKGVMQADIRVQYLSVIEFFVVNLTAGQSVEITRLQTLPA